MVRFPSISDMSSSPRLTVSSMTFGAPTTLNGDVLAIDADARSVVSVEERTKEEVRTCVM